MKRITNPIMLNKDSTPVVMSFDYTYGALAKADAKCTYLLKHDDFYKYLNTTIPHLSHDNTETRRFTNLSLSEEFIRDYIE